MKISQTQLRRSDGRDEPLIFFYSLVPVFVSHVLLKLRAGAKFIGARAGQCEFVVTKKSHPSLFL